MNCERSWKGTYLGAAAVPNGIVATSMDVADCLNNMRVPNSIVATEEDIDFVKDLRPPSNAESQVVADLSSNIYVSSDIGETDEDDNINQPTYSGIYMLELLSVTVHFKHLDHAQLHKVYGMIYATDSKGMITFLFTRDKEAPMFVPHGGSLPLSVTFSLTYCGDDDRDAEIARGSIRVDYDTLTDYNQAIAQTVTGKIGYATLHYAKLACAGFTRLDVQVSGFSGDVYGSLAVRRTHIRDDEKQPSLVCIMQPNEPVNVVDIGTTISLSRPLVFVPSLSTLVFEANIWDHATGLKLVDQAFLEFEMWDNNMSLSHRKSIKGINGLVVQVKAEWFHPYVLFFEAFDDPMDDVYLHPPILPMIGWTNRTPSTPIIRCGIKSGHFVEVYSIAVGSYTNGTLNVYGDISISDGRDTQCIFRREKDCPFRVEGYCKLPRCTRSHFKALGSEYLEIRLKLKDTNNGRVVSRGRMCSNAPSQTRQIPVYERRVAFGVKGDVGYAVAHYTRFINAVEAKARVYICTNDSTEITAQVEGRIDTYFTNYKYRNAYEREFFQRTHFEDCTSITCMPYATFWSAYSSTSNALVAESVVVPKDTPLAFKTLLRVRLPGESDFEVLDVEDVDFPASCVGSFCKANNQGKYRIVICVDWWDHYLPLPKGCQPWLQQQESNS